LRLAEGRNTEQRHPNGAEDAWELELCHVFLAAGGANVA
jgi:hypothetical protein